MIFYPIPYVTMDTNPVVSEIKNGKQKITLYDSKTDKIKTIETTPDKIDEFIKNRSKAWKPARITTALTSIIGAGFGVFCGLTGKGKKDMAVTAILGVLFGLAGGLGGSLVSSPFGNRAENKITQEFIEANK